MRLKATLLVVCAIVLSGQQTPQQTLRGLRAAPGMEVTLWASEPALSNPTNIAVDERLLAPTELGNEPRGVLGDRQDRLGDVGR